MAETAASDSYDHDIRPVVATSGAGNLGLYIFMGLLLIGGVWLFALMNAARQNEGAPATTIPRGYAQDQIRAGAPPALPGRFTDDSYSYARPNLPPAPANTAPRIVSPPVPVVQATPRTLAPSPTYTPQAPSYREPLPPAPATRADLPQADQATGNEVKSSAERVKAGRLANPSLTVPLGTIIPAVLETALDSTRSGSVRALVQRDVHSFDGSRVLIPRGSRLYGNYKGELAQGQNRAMVTWTRLLRPDGVTIALDSDASDPLGRAGIKGKVNSKFWQRFGGAILQSVLDLGVGIATQKATGGVIVALPGSTQNVTRLNQEQITPTLKVKQGTSVSVYVARDLDFSSVE